MAFSSQQYRDPDTGRQRWAVSCPKTSVWYFPGHYGKRAATQLASRLNRGAHQ
jgi:hypothetical protein